MSKSQTPDEKDFSREKPASVTRSDIKKVNNDEDEVVEVLARNGVHGSNEGRQRKLAKEILAAI